MPASSIGVGSSPAISSATKMPCWKPRWASCRPGHDVADGEHAVDVGAQPLVGEHEPAVHRDALLLVAQALRCVGPRPTATSSSSASIVSPPWTVTRTPSSVCSTDSNGVPVRSVMPRLRNARSRTLETASSSAATRRGSASTIVTSAPKDLHTLANSQPMTPPPSTMADAGTRSS